MADKKTVNARTANMFRELAVALASKKFDVELIGAKKGEALLKKRVFNEGRAMDGGKIGVYSTKPGYYGRDSFIRKGAFKPGGNPQAKRKKKKPTSMFLKSGYKNLRDINGRQTNFVDLQYSGDLFQSIQIATSEGKPVLKIISNKEAEISEGLEGRFGKTIFELSGSERAIIKKDMGTAISKEVSKFLKNQK